MNAADFIARRLRTEFALLFMQLPVIGSCVAYLAYFGYMVFRNLAFYRFSPGPRLPDLGHAYIPSLGPSLHALGEFPMLLLYLLVAALSLATFVPPSPTCPPKPYFINMFRRFVSILAAGHTLRFLSYIGTSLPGAADHCMPGMVESLTPPKPTTLAEILTRYAASPGSNCGDLVFSGHMLQAITFGFIVTRYGQRCFSLAGRAETLLRAATFTLVASQAFFVVAARNHYTVDVIVACYTTPLLWYFYVSAVHPVDLEPEAAALPAWAGLSPPKGRRAAKVASRDGSSADSGLGTDADGDSLLLLSSEMEKGYGV
jgi:PAP2 superfamily C-terminal